MRVFPLFVSVENKKILVVGAGKIAARRIKALLPFEADLVIVAPEIRQECCFCAEEKRVHVIHREYQSQDIEGAFLVLACSNRADVNEQVCADAKKLGILVNRCDKKEDCDFYFPGIALKGDVVAGISAGGNDHALAKKATEKVRDLFERELKERED